jgi:hypothetical protein
LVNARSTRDISWGDHIERKRARNRELVVINCLHEEVQKIIKKNGAVLMDAESVGVMCMMEVSDLPPLFRLHGLHFLTAALLVSSSIW